VAVFFGRPQVDVDIIHAFFFLKKGLFLDRLGLRSLNAVPITLDMTFKLSPISNMLPPVNGFSCLGGPGAASTLQASGGTGMAMAAIPA
jgi:hypothetical protein